jgi:hypothetical protein
MIAKSKADLSQFKDLQTQFNQCKNDRDALQEKMISLIEDNEKLAQYRGIVKIDDKIKEKIAYGKQKLDELQEELNRTKCKISLEIDEAHNNKKKILEQANIEAQEIAGKAYEAKANAQRYEAMAQAMKNVIEGYGDQYIIPSHTLLDDLAEEFGHTDAGNELKKARNNSRQMIRNGIAAVCDYVEDERRQYAINFVIDAFNGKVDSILSRVKSNNIGKLQQELRDAFNLVNLNGQAFRNARITEEYLNARFEELRWAVIIEELKIQDKEEQRKIKEQLRDEERAQREYVRVMREAAKEEEILRKAMEKVQQDVATANAEQKAQYEAKLMELNEKLKVAEEKNQRALSMAQQTKKGFVYVISNIGSFGENVYKIGLTRRLEPMERIDELGDASVPFDFDVHAIISCDDAPALEKSLHKQFVIAQVNKVNQRKEFFRVPLKQIREEIDKLGIEAKWTMLSEAKEYKESLAVEKSIKEDATTRDKWIKHQQELESVNLQFLNESTQGDFSQEGLKAS